MATHLRYVIFGGEALELPSLRPWFERHGDAQPELVNMYGITETTVHVTYRPITLARRRGRRRERDRRADPGSAVYAPRPARQRRCRSASPGELYVGGAGVARGYLNRPELTRRALRPDPFAGRRRAGCTAPATWRGASRRRPRVPRPHRPPGEDPRLPHRARRDRGRARSASRRARGAWSSRARTRRATSASSPTSSAAASAARPSRSCGRASRARAAGVHGAGAFRAARRAAADAQRQGRPQGPARAGAWRPETANGRTSRRGRRRKRRSPSLGGGARRRARRRPRQLLRARRRLDPQHPGGRAVPRRPGCSSRRGTCSSIRRSPRSRVVAPSAADVREPEEGRPAAWCR